MTADTAMSLIGLGLAAAMTLLAGIVLIVRLR